MVEFLFQFRPRVGDVGEELFVFGQKVLDVAGAFVGAVRIPEVEVEIGSLDPVEGDAPREFVFHAGLEAVGPAAPPGLLRLELLDADGLGLVVALRARRIGVLVVPDLAWWARPW